MREGLDGGEARRHSLSGQERLLFAHFDFLHQVMLSCSHLLRLAVLIVTTWQKTVQSHFHFVLSLSPPLRVDVSALKALITLIRVIALSILFKSGKSVVQLCLVIPGPGGTIAKISFCDEHTALSGTLVVVNTQLFKLFLRRKVLQFILPNFNGGPVRGPHK